MSRDFASRQHRRTNAAGSSSARQGAAPASRKSKAPVASAQVTVWQRLPGWSWLLLGLVAGFMISQLTMPPAPTPLAQATQPKSDAEPSGTSPSKAAQQAAEVADEVASTADETAAPSPRFDFYTLLPESEVIAPSVEAYASPEIDEADLPRYLLQVSSFRNADDARRLGGRLQKLGFDNIKISAVRSSNGETWHRVQVGPYQDRRLMNEAQDRLADAGLESMRLRLKNESQ